MTAAAVLVVVVIGGLLVARALGAANDWPEKGRKGEDDER